MPISPELEAKILDQLSEFGEVKADLRTVKEDISELKDSVAELVASAQRNRGAKNVVIAGVGAVGGLISSGAVDLFLKLTGKH